MKVVAETNVGQQEYGLAGSALRMRIKMVREAGLEPAQYYYRKILSLVCLPIPPLAHIGILQGQKPKIS